jgi:hypothetical protein
MFHYKVYKIWMSWLGIIFFITACGPVTAVPEVKSALVITPPPATLEVDAVTQMASIGSYCWSSGGAISKSLCADMAGIPTASDPLVLTEFPVNAKFHFEMELAPNNVTMSVMPAKSGQELVFGIQAKGGADRYRQKSILSIHFRKLNLSAGMDSTLS